MQTICRNMSIWTVCLKRSKISNVIVLGNNKIRNCLAGFESLETELISAITSFYLHSDNKEIRASVKLLTAQWQLEMNKFQNVVNLIINSAAFCQVDIIDRSRITLRMLERIFYSGSFG